MYHFIYKTTHDSVTPPVPTPASIPSTPTAAELSAQLTALQAQIAALTPKS